MNASDYLNRCHFGDCLDTLRRMPDAFVHCGISSPPYYGLRDYSVPPTDWPAMEYRTLGGVLQVPAMSCCLGLEPTPEAFIGHIVLIYREVRRVLRDDGTVWLNLGDSYTGYWGEKYAHKPFGDDRTADSSTPPNKATAFKDWGLKNKNLIGIPWRVAFALQADGWYLRQDIIWHKPNPMPESVRDRCTKAHEYIFLLSKAERYYFDSEATKEPSVTNDPRRPYTSKGAKDLDGRSEWKSGQARDKGDFSLRNKRSVWTVATKPYKGAHFATYPEELVEPMVLAGCPPGGIVLDQFFGSGTTGAVAQRLGRQWIGCELNTAYKPLQDERLRQPSLSLE